MDLSLSTLLTALLTFALILPAIILHEVSHGWVAYKLGDPTAKMMGRLTLDPRKHIDPWGTILMPLLLLVVSGGRFAFGYAKPVPFDPRNFRDRRTGMLLTGIAGPAMNLALAVVASLLFRVLVLIPAVPNIVLFLAWMFVYLNLFLMFFNLIPIPPMDGSRVVQRFLSGQLLTWYYRIERYGFLFIIALLVWGRPVFDAYLSVTLDPTVKFLTGAALM